MSLDGFVAIVTGAGSATGIGFAAAAALSALGARVVVAATTARVEHRVAELRAAGADAQSFTGDLTTPNTPERLVSTALSAYGRLDILVNNAGMMSVLHPADATQAWPGLPDWRAGMARDLDIAYAVCLAAAPVLSSGARIINVASVTGPVMAMRGLPQYAAAKAGLVGLTRALAIDLADRAITVNAVLPGWIATGSQDEGEAREGASVPLGRSGTPEEIAAAIAWLSTPGAAYITGQVIVVDGGNSIAEQRR